MTAHLEENSWVETADVEALAELYHRLLTGLLLALALRAGAARGSEVVFRAFRRQQLEKFLPGLEKLGLRHLPPAVACAKYHHLSNVLGGAKVEWIPETDRKSWVRYLPPRWIFDGTALCGIPSEMSRAMLWGWHANNGALLGNARLGFVCTSLATDGGPGAIGYYLEGDRDLAPDERLRFAPGERPPPAPAAEAAPEAAGAAPVFAKEPAHLAKIKRNYSMEYVRSLLSAMLEVLGPAEAAHIGRTAARQIGMQFHDAVCVRLNLAPDERHPVGSCAELMQRLLGAHGDRCDRDTTGAQAWIRQSSWRFGAGLDLPAEGFEIWNGLLEGLVAVHSPSRALRLTVERRLDLGDDCFEWRLR
jgi:hypothetical protein